MEKEFSSLLNISPDSIERVPSNPQAPPFCLREEDFQGSSEVPKLKAWRLFFYLEKIKNYTKRDDKKLTNIVNLLLFRTSKCASRTSESIS